MVTRKRSGVLSEDMGCSPHRCSLIALRWWLRELWQQHRAEPDPIGEHALVRRGGGADKVMAAVPPHTYPLSYGPGMHAGSNCVDQPDHLVPWDAWIRNRIRPAVLDEGITMADAAGFHF